LSDKEAVLTVDATLDGLDAVNEFVDELLKDVPCTDEMRAKLDILVEEVFVNIVNYAYAPGTGRAAVRGRISPNPDYVITLVFEDSGIKFNPLERKESLSAVAVRKRAKNRQRGGLGIFLVCDIADEIHYEWRDGKNILTVKKRMV